MSIEEKYLSLPPFCDGKLRGNLNLVIEKIDWKTSKFYHKIKLNILWWGQTEGVSSECCRSSENPLEIIKYTIKTNPSLFQSYLKNCEPLKIEFRSSKTNEFIGTSKIEISSKIKNNFPVKSTGKILSKTNFDLGEITVSINLREMKTLNTSLEFVQKNNSTNSKLSFQLKKSQKEQLNKENMLVETYSRNVVSGNVSEKKDKAIVLPLKTYLSGQSMTAKQEIDVIKTLKDKSPTLSFIESHQEKLRQTPKLTQDCIRIKILNASFHVNTDEDTKLFMMDSIVSKSVVKCAILSKVFEKTDEIKLLSPVITTSPVDSVSEYCLKFLTDNSFEIALKSSRSQENN